MKRSFDNCPAESTEEEELGYPLYYYNRNSELKLFAPTNCIDCKTKRNASKNKPDFWPNPGLYKKLLRKNS